MTDSPNLKLEPDAEDEAGEFFLPHLDADASTDTDSERLRYDEQILAALVSP